VGCDFSHVQTGPGAHPASCTVGTGSFPGVKRPGRGADHPPPSSAGVTKGKSYTCIHPLGQFRPVTGLLCVVLHMRTHFCSFKGLLLQKQFFVLPSLQRIISKCHLLALPCLPISRVTNLKPLIGFTLNVNLTQRSLVTVCRRNIVLIRFELTQWAFYLMIYMHSASISNLETYRT
jgi:hypothetical protein